METKEKIRYVLLTLFCILLNYFGRQLAVRMQLPLWLDVVGTILAAYFMGPVHGAVVGLTNNLINALWEPAMLYYAVVSVVIGLVAGYAGKKKYINSFLMAMTVAVGITLLSVLISTPISLLIGEVADGNIWGKGVRDYFLELNLPRVLATGIGNLYVEFLDKTVSVLFLYLLIRIREFILSRRPEKTPENEKASSGEIKKALLFLLIPLFFSPLKVRAEDETSWIQTVFSSDNGLPCGHANDVAESGDGILWIATYAGLYRYNGSEFRYMNELEDVKNANCLFVDGEGRLWIGTNDNGLAMMINERIVNVYRAEDGLPSESIRCIRQGDDGAYYIGTANGLAILKLNDGISVSAVLEEVGYVTELTACDNGAIALVNSEGRLFLIRGGAVVEEHSETSYSSCFCDRDGSLYAGTTEGTLQVFSVSDRLKEEREIRCPGLSKINSIRVRSNGDIWVCADNGIGRLIGGKGFEKPETGDFNFSIEKMCEDYQGNLWFASSRQGLLRLTPSPFTELYRLKGLEDTVVNTTALWNGRLYAGTDDGLDILKLSGSGKVTDEFSKLFSESRVRCLTVDRKDRLWVCSYGAGLVCTDRKGTVTQFEECGSRVRVCRELADGTMAASGSEGLFYIKNGKVVNSIPYGADLGSAAVLCMEEESDGSLLAGTDGNGIFRIRDGKISAHITKENGLPSDVILRIVKDSEEGKFFLVTSNSLCYLEGDTVRTFSSFPYSNNYDVIRDEDGELFVPGSSGVYVVDRDQLLNAEKPEVVLLDSRLGLMGSLTANSWSAYTEDKLLYLCTDRGIFAVDTDAYRPPRRSYRLRVNEVRMDEKSSRIERGRSFSIPREVNRLELVCEVVNYTLEDPEISYYLEGLDSSWTTVLQSELSTVTYTNLPPGDYSFHLAILDPDNGALLEESIYSFTKEKAIYDNGWFRYYMIIVGGLFVGWLTAYITRRQVQGTMRMQQERLEMSEKQNRMSDETIMAIAATVDAKDERTSQHSKRVSDYSVLIAREYGFTKKEQENLRRAALLHDIGKVGIPDRILNKPARLDDEEYAVMKTHVTRGAEILKGLTSIDHVVEGARYHHERYDGRGYPDGLKGEEIPLYGRIIAIADAFDAMTANRVYRKKQDFSYVLNELKNNRGSQFDPQLLDIFLKLIDDRVIDVEALYGSASGMKKEDKTESPDRENEAEKGKEREEGGNA